MKRFSLFLLSVMLLSLCACGSPKVYDVYLDEGTFTVDTVNQTITFGEHVIAYELNGKSSGSSVKFVYPDGSEYYWEKSGYMGFGGWSNDYDENRYIDGDTLCDVLESEADAAHKAANEGAYFSFGLMGLIAIALGALDLQWPERMWYLSRGWMFKNAEPSDAAIAMVRLSGVLCILMGLAAIAYAIFA